jgi:hypothetical protein
MPVTLKRLLGNLKARIALPMLREILSSSQSCRIGLMQPPPKATHPARLGVAANYPKRLVPPIADLVNTRERRRPWRRIALSGMLARSPKG